MTKNSLFSLKIIAQENLQFPYNSYPRIELENMQDDAYECLAECRVKKEDVPRLADVLQLPEPVRCVDSVPCVAELKVSVCCYDDWHTHVDSSI